MKMLWELDMLCWGIRRLRGCWYKITRFKWMGGRCSEALMKKTYIERKLLPFERAISMKYLLLILLNGQII